MTHRLFDLTPPSLFPSLPLLASMDVAEQLINAHGIVKNITREDRANVSRPTAGAAVGSLSASGAGTPASGIEKEFELPQASVGRILKRKLPEGVTVSKEAKQAFAKAGGIFVLYLTHASNSFCRTDRRQTISARDVFDGLRCIQFEEFIEPLEKSLQEMREEAVAKKKAKKTEDTTGTDKTPSSSTNQAPQASPQGDDNLASTQRATADKT
eukprot:CAMPEP_0171567558 /NCGR_PEP_ID=MMETSP0961-20121227/1230_1 /TAXON_ID=87120 /ORGANISM="Aurantiochytrium limacinum, Strain ATCCMYA-1381" /LENGTH=211 /DNA_ID=CAMNT_0012121499 /DNA_START=92 /DNA_END=727 /DNA_ORIENTATION=+